MGKSSASRNGRRRQWTRAHASKWSGSWAGEQIELWGSLSQEILKLARQGGARGIPFRDGEFDAAWSICVFEHVPNPGMVLSEIRRSTLASRASLRPFHHWPLTPHHDRWEADSDTMNSLKRYEDYLLG